MRKYKRFHCSYLGGRIITIEKCERCKMSLKCDIYAIMLDDSEEDEVC
jgi:hypothetical protein